MRAAEGPAGPPHQHERAGASAARRETRSAMKLPDRSGGEPLVVDGAHGEGGGQLLRTALALAAATGRRLRLLDIRAGRRNPGLAAQHLTAVRAAAALCEAVVAGDALGSRSLDFAPRRPVRAGEYVFDVAAAREGGSAGAATLVLQTVLPPLALTEGASRLVVRGGTHLPWSPSYDYAAEVWGPALAEMGIHLALSLARFGFFPLGGGEIQAEIAGRAGAPFAPIERCERAPISRVQGRAFAANLPSHIAQRMADRAGALIEAAGLPAAIRAERVTAACPGAGISLVAEHGRARAGFAALGARGKPAEQVAEEAVAELLAFERTEAAVDRHLADQLLVPAALAGGPSRFTTERVTRHLTTNAWVVERFGLARVAIEGREGETGSVTVVPAAEPAAAAGR